MRVAVAIVLLLLPAAVQAQAEKRIALLIGNKDYKAGVGSLTNPLNDIRIVGDALKSVGFEVLKPVENAQRSAMLSAIHAFAAKLKASGPAAVGFLYHSGHGIASAGENYLIPTDVDEPSTVQLSVQGVKQSEVLAILRGEASNAAHYLVLLAAATPCKGRAAAKALCRSCQRPRCEVRYPGLDQALRVIIKTWRPQRVHISYAAINGEANSRKEHEFRRALTYASVKDVT